MTALRIRERLVGAASDARRALSCVELALHITAWIEHDYRDPCERAAVTLITREGHVAELWRALHAELEEAEEQLNELCVDLGLLDEALDEGDAPHLDDAETSTSVVQEAAPTWIEEQRRGNGAVPSAASISPVEDRQPLETQETTNHGTLAHLG